MFLYVWSGYPIADHVVVVALASDMDKAIEQGIKAILKDNPDREGDYAAIHAYLDWMSFDKNVIIIPLDDYKDSYAFAYCS